MALGLFFHSSFAVFLGIFTKDGKKKEQSEASASEKPRKKKRRARGKFREKQSTDLRETSTGIFITETHQRMSRTPPAPDSGERIAFAVQVFGTGSWHHMPAFGVWPHVI